MFHPIHHVVGVNGPWFWMQAVLHGLLWVGLIGLLVWGVVALSRRPTTSTVAAPQPSALEILSQRYARGEIDAATYNEMRRQILGGDQPTQV